MKLTGQTLLAPKPVELPFVRRDEDGNETYITITVKPVLSFEDFETKFPIPTPPKSTKGGLEFLNAEDPTFKIQILDYSELKVNWLILESLKATEVEWDTITEDPTTWSNWKDEFLDSGFTRSEIQLIESEIYTICGMTATNMEETRKRFLAWKREKAQSTKS
jgi:hypothetical protein